MFSVPFSGPWQTVQTQIRHHRNGIKMKSTPDTPKNGNGLIQMIRMDKSTEQIYGLIVYCFLFCFYLPQLMKFEAKILLDSCELSSLLPIFNTSLLFHPAFLSQLCIKHASRTGTLYIMKHPCRLIYFRSTHVDKQIIIKFFIFIYRNKSSTTILCMID